MSNLQAELERLFLSHTAPNGTALAADGGMLSPDGRVRSMVLELARPADWGELSGLWRGVQTDLEFPAPAIAVNGVDGYQLWFSMLEPVPAAQARDFLESLRLRYLQGLAPKRIAIWPAEDAGAPPVVHHASLVPALQETGRWSAFVAPDLASIFSQGPWIDFPPNPQAQAKVLSRLECTKPAVFQAALARLQPVERMAAPASFANAAAPVTASAPVATALEPRQFLRDVMRDPGVALQLRIEAAKALLPYSDA